MSNIRLNIFDVDVPSMGGTYRIIYVCNSPVKDYSFHSFENHETEVERFINNLKYILGYEAFKDSKSIEISFNKMLKMNTGGKQQNYIDLGENQQQDVLDIIEKNFPGYEIITGTISS